MLHVLVTDEFSAWWSRQKDAVAEEVATAVDVVERLGPARTAPDSQELLLWYEHPGVSGRPSLGGWVTDNLGGWAAFYGYAKRVLGQLDSPRFVRRLSRLSARDAASVLRAVERIKCAAAPLRWLRQIALPAAEASWVTQATADVRRWYLEALSAAGIEPVDVPAHSLGLRELSVASRTEPRVRLLYGVDAMKEVALFVVGETLERAFYGDSVRWAERTWQEFLRGSLQAVDAAAAR